MVRWLLLVIAVAILLTNAYYLKFLEPTVSRKALAIVVLAGIGLVFFTTRVGLPRSGPDLLAVGRRLVIPIVLLVILAVGFSLRLWGISSGLPQSYVPDEYDYVHSPIKMMKRGDFNPRWWYYPSLQPYLTLGTYTTVFLLEARTGRWKSDHEIVEEDMLYWGRFVGVVFGTGTILLIFLLGRHLLGTRVGLMAAALLAVFPAAVEHSQVNKPDPVLAFMTTLGVLLACVYFQKGGKRLALACGVAIGLAVATKYNGLLVAIPFVLAVSLRHGRRFLAEPDVYLGAIASILAFFVACPYVFADFPRFLDHLGYDLYSYGFAGKEGGTGDDNWGYHARYMILYGSGLWAFLAGIGGLGLALYRLDARFVVALSFPVIYASYLSSQRLHWPGNMIPVYPFLAILAAYAIREAAAAAAGWIHNHSKVSFWARSEPFATAGALILVMWFPLQTSVRHNMEVTLPDAGNVAREWINETFEPGTHFAVERHAPVPDRKRFQVTQEARIIRRSVGDYREQGVQYFVVSSMVYERYGPEHRLSHAYQKLFQ
ncbi:MAG: glycosyltransferase family 39 protein, partial [Vicinamibacteria bacterium]